MASSGPHIIAHRQTGKESAIIFLHGFYGDPHTTWGLFPELLSNDTRLDEWDIFNLGYSTKLSLDLIGLWTADPELEILARYLNTAASNYPLNNYKHIVLIAHSMGGLVVQRALLDYKDFLDRVSHVFLFATPSSGLTKASLVSKFKKQWRDLSYESEFIKNLRQNWTEQFGDTPPFKFISIAGDRDEFVPWNSSISPFQKSQCEVIPGNHIQVVKPTDPNDLSVQIVLKGLVGSAVHEESTLKKIENRIIRRVSWATNLVEKLAYRKKTIIAIIIFILISIIIITRYMRPIPIDSIAVLPFTNVMTEANSEYISDGITEGIINNLSQSQNLKVIAFGTVSKYKGHEIDPRAIGTELKVQTVLTGKIQKQNNEYIINVEMIDISNGTRLWGEKYIKQQLDASLIENEIFRDLSKKVKLN